jgi:hypothetical protein
MENENYRLHSELPQWASRQKTSKAIKIVEPDTGEVRIPPKASTIHQTLPASTKRNVTSQIPTNPKLSNATAFYTALPLPRTTEKSNQTSESLPVNPPLFNQVGQESLAGDFEHAFDVYARPFVPQALSVINTLKGHIIHTPARNHVAFEAYSRGYMGVEFLPRIPEPIALPLFATPEVTHSEYEQYFRYHLEEEIRSQELENVSYSLYAASAIDISYNSELDSKLGPARSLMCRFKIPGLRENSPYIEEDDVVEIRQLRYEGWEKLVGTGDGMFGVQPPIATPIWTGVVFEARVLSVQRKNEEIVVAVAGLMALDYQQSLSGASRPRFNIQFPVPKHRYTPIQQVLPVIQEGLVLYDNQKDYNKSDGPHHWLKSMLFPTEEDGKMQTRLNPGAFSRDLFDNQLNREQQKAVESICLQNYGTLPYLISGPPGTGKTKTLVETALQLIKNDHNVSHVLICAPSDPATDTLVQRLSKHLNPSEMLRLNRPSRTFAEVPDSVLPYCHVPKGQYHNFSLPPFETLMSYKVVVTTCRDASLLLYSRMTNSDLFAAEFGLRRTIHPCGKIPKVDLHWGALLVDEAAQAIEPEVLLALSVVAPPREFVWVAFTPLFIMVGDEYQLCPRTSLPSSPLRASLLERLFKRPVYARHPLARSQTGRAPPPLNKTMLPILRPAFTNLIRNYRSHPAILAVPSALFYADTLEPEVEDPNLLASWSQWQGRKWPVLFVSNNSQDDLEQDGGGWFNPGEAQIASWYASHLVESGLVQPKEICIMSPFSAQVARLRKTVRKTPKNWEVNIGPTEAFQGLERAVVILCTTRSRQRFVERDQKAGWGLIGMPNKMNVALTRAKFGLVVIGKKDVLTEDPNWKAFINFCERNGLVAGNTIGGASPDALRQRTRLEKVLLEDEPIDEGTRVLGGVSHDDEMWTSEQHTVLDMSD